MPDFNPWYPTSPHGTGFINVKSFGAKGDSLTDDAIAIQKAFDTAWGPKEAPHGEANKHKNRAVYFPPGSYPVNQTLYITGVRGGKIFGDGAENTLLSLSKFLINNQGTVWRPSEPTPKLTPLICMNGCSYFVMENMGFSIGGGVDAPPGSCVFDICNHDPLGISTMIQFVTSTVGGGDYGIVVGRLDSGVGNDCGSLFNVNCAGIDLAGLRLESPSAVNWMVVGGGASEVCTTGGTFDPGVTNGQYEAGYSCIQGQISLIYAMSNSADHFDVINAGGNAMSIQSGSSESRHCFATMNKSVTSVGSYSFRNTNVTNKALAVRDALVHCTTGIHTPSGSTIGYFVDVGNNGRAIIDNTLKGGPGGGETLGFVGSPGSAVWLRGWLIGGVAGVDYFSGFTGQIVSHKHRNAAGTDMPLSDTPAHNKFRGLMRIISDATSNTTGEIVIGGGANRVMAYCTGAEWRVLGPVAAP